MPYLYPVRFSRSTSWGAHRRRQPPSSEAGIDMFCDIGTPVLAAEAGRVVDTGDSIGPATGRFVTIDLDDGRRVRYLHLSRRIVKIGDRVKRGQTIGYSGATGYGEEDWSWNVAETGGAHVHMTLWPSQRYVFGGDGTLDPSLYFEPQGSAASTNATPIPKEWDEMASRDDIKSAVAEVLASSKPNDRFIVAYASDGPRNGIVLAGMGYWHPLSGEKWEHFNWLKSAQGRTLFQGLEVFTPINDRSWDILREICQNDGVIDGDVVDYARISELVTKVDVDEVALAEQLTPALVAAMSNHVGTLTDATITSLVQTLLDEQSKRLAA